MKKLVLLFVALLVAGCGSTGGDGGASEGGDSSALNDGTTISDDGSGMDDEDGWNEPSGETPDNRIGEPPVAYIVTSSALSEAWKVYAARRTVEGFVTRVVTMEEISSSYDGEDDAAKLRAFIRHARDEGARFVLLGGDRDVVPFMRIPMAISIPMVGDYSTCGPAEIYFSNVDADFDSDGDGIYGEKDEDLSLEEISNATVAVGRVPVDTEEEVAAYLAKVEAYEQGAGGRASYPLLLSDVATEILGVEVDGAEGVEKTVDAYFPQEFRSHARRLYATEGAASQYGGEVGTPENIRGALEQEGYSLVFHNGHGLWNWLTNILDSGWIRSLKNEIPPVMASCACLAGNFADIADDAQCENWSAEQGTHDDSAGELFITLEHGGVAYIGNTGTGLGIIGGTQFLHAFFDGLFAQGLATIGEAFTYAHRTMNSVELSYSGVPDLTTDDSRYWTHLVVILLGDPMLRIWTAQPRTLSVDGIPGFYGPGRNEWVVSVHDGGGAPVGGALVTLYKDGDFLLQKETGPDGTATFLFYPRGRGRVTAGVVADGFAPVVVVSEPQ